MPNRRRDNTGEWLIDNIPTAPQWVVRRQSDYTVGQSLRKHGERSTFPNRARYPHRWDRRTSERPGYNKPNNSSLGPLAGKSKSGRNATMPAGVEGTGQHESEIWNSFNSRSINFGGYNNYQGWYSVPPTPGSPKPDERYAPPNGFLPDQAMTQGMSLQNTRGHYPSAIDGTAGAQSTLLQGPSSSSLAGPSTHTGSGHAQSSQRPTFGRHTQDTSRYTSERSTPLRSIAPKLRSGHYGYSTQL